MSGTRPTFDDGKHGANQELAWPSALRDFSALEAELVEKVVSGKLNVVEKARACATLMNELGLTQQLLADRLGCHQTKVSHLMRLLALSEEILELVERGKLGEGHGRALLMVKDPEGRRELAYQAIEEGWSTRTLQTRARESTSAASVSSKDAPAPRRGPQEHGQDPGAGIQTAAEVWGDVLAVEVHIRTMARGRVRLEVLFTSARAAIATARRLSEAVTRDLVG
jgi:ParB family chromosome partitioning protein